MYQQYTNIFAAARKAKGLTQEKLAELTGVSIGTIKAYEGDKTIPKDAEIVRRFVNILDAPHLYAELSNMNPLNQNVIPRINTNQPFINASMNTVKSMKEIQPQDADTFFFITSKGAVGEDEQDEYDAIMKKLENMASSYLNQKFAKK
jgi:transcriptional regulator with XRE-family HTH domain